MAEQSISYEGRDLSNPKATMKESGVGDKAMLLLRRKVNVAGMRVHSIFLTVCLVTFFACSVAPDQEKSSETLR